MIKGGTAPYADTVWAQYLKTKMIIRALLLAFLISIKVFPQEMKDTIIYFGINGRIVNKENAKSYKSFCKSSDDEYIVRSYFLKENKWETNGYYEKYLKINDSIIICEYYNYNDLLSSCKLLLKEINDSIYFIKEFSESDELRNEGYYYSFPPILKTDKHLTYYRDNNEIHTISYYKNNELIDNIILNREGDTIATKVYYDVDILPKYKNDEYDNKLRLDIQRIMRYPEYAAERGIQGKVYVEFIIMEDGSMHGINVVEGVATSLDNEAVRVIKKLSKGWSPGYLDNKAVKVIFTIPLVFVIQ